MCINVNSRKLWHCAQLSPQPHQYFGILAAHKGPRTTNVNEMPKDDRIKRNPESGGGRAQSNVSTCWQVLRAIGGTVCMKICFCFVCVKWIFAAFQRQIIENSAGSARMCVSQVAAAAFWAHNLSANILNTQNVRYQRCNGTSHLVGHVHSAETQPPLHLHSYQLPDSALPPHYCIAPESQIKNI